jgi:hypothetical protein
MYQFSTPLNAVPTARVASAMNNSVAVALQQLADAARQTQKPAS